MIVKIQTLTDGENFMEKKNRAGKGRLKVWGEVKIATLYRIIRICFINKVKFKLSSKGGAGINHQDIYEQNYKSRGSKCKGPVVEPSKLFLTKTRASMFEQHGLQKSISG